MDNPTPLPRDENNELAKPNEQETIFTPDMTDMTGYDKNLRNARIWLYVIAGLQGAMGIYEYFAYADFGEELRWAALGIDIGIGIVFLVLAIWSRKKPAPAFLSALIFYIAISVTFMILDSTNIYKGIILKVLIVIALVKGYKDAKEYDDLKKSIG